MEELYDLLCELNIEIAYHHFENPVTPPFIVYYRIKSNNFKADDKVFEKINTYRIEIYTTKKDVMTEILLENLLDNNGFTYEVISESYIEQEKLYQVIYELDI